MANSISVYRQNGVDYVIDDPTIAPVFVTNTAYTKGQYVKHGGNLYRFVSDHAAGAWTGNDVAQITLGADLKSINTSVAGFEGDITDIGTSIDNIETDIDKMNAVVAPEFSTSGTYTKGQYVKHGGNLYRFVTDHAPGAWTGTDSAQVTIGSDLKGILTLVETAQGDISDIETDVAKANAVVAPEFTVSGTYTKGQYVRHGGNLYRFVTDHAPGAWTGTDSAQVTIGTDLKGILTLIETAQGDISDIEAVVAPEFTVSGTYTKNQYVRHGGNLYRFVTDHAPGAWTGTDSAQVMIGSDLKGILTLIETAQGDISNIETDVAKANAVVAPEFTVSGTYTKGQYVRHGGNLYRFVADHSPGEWTGTDSAQITIGAELNSINTSVKTLQEGVGRLDSVEADIEKDEDTNTYLWGNSFDHGKNLFNYKAITKGVVITSTGAVFPAETGYTSDFIAVKPSTQYHKRFVFSSENTADVAFYTDEKTLISVSCHGNGTVTTPNNCAYVKLCGYVDYAVGEVFEAGSSFSSHEFYRTVTSPKTGGTHSAYLFSIQKIIYDRDTGSLVAVNSTNENAYIDLLIPGFGVKKFYTPVAVSGSYSTAKFLYYDRAEESFLFASNAVYKDDYYLIQTTVEDRALTLKAELDGLFIVSADPILTVDMIGNAVHVNIGAGCYLWYKQSYQALTVESYDLTINRTGINLLYFNPVTKKFTVSNSFVANRSATEVVPCGVIDVSNIDLRVPYKVASVDPKLQGKTVITYGDSLTWYDGQAFTWGEHMGETCFGYQSYLKYYSGANIINRGASGKTTPQFVADNLKTDGTAMETADYIIIMPSIDNDDRLSVSPGTVQPIGGTFDTSTTAGALQDAIEYIYNVNPAVRIVLMVEPQGFTYTNGAPKLCNELLATAVRNVAKLYGLPLIDLWEQSGINAITRDTFYADPPFGNDNQLYMYHPNNDGWERMSRLICAEMQKI